MAEVLAFIESDCPSIFVHKTVKADFDEGISFPPTGQSFAQHVQLHHWNAINDLKLPPAPPQRSK